MLFYNVLALTNQQPYFLLKPGADNIVVEIMDPTSAFNINDKVTCALSISFSPLILNQDEIRYQNYQSFEYKTTYRNSFVIQLSSSHRTNNMYTMIELLKKLVSSSSVDAVLTIQSDQPYTFQGKFVLNISSFEIQQTPIKTFTVAASAEVLQIAFNQEVSQPLLINFKAQNTSINFEATPVTKLVTFPISFLARSPFTPYSIRVLSKSTLESFLLDTTQLSQRPITAPVIAYNAQRVHLYILNTRFNVQFNDSLGQLYKLYNTVASFIITDRQSRFQFIKQVLIKPEMNFEISKLEFSKFTWDYDEVMKSLVAGTPFAQSFGAEFGFNSIDVSLRNFNSTAACDVELLLNTDFDEQKFVKKLAVCTNRVSFGVENLVYPHVDNWYAQVNSRQNNVQLMVTQNGISKYFTYSSAAPIDAPIEPVIRDPSAKIVVGIVVGVVIGFIVILGFVILMLWFARRHKYGVASLTTLRVAA